MTAVLVALHVLFFVPVLLRSGSSGPPGRRSVLAELAAGLRSPAMVVHGAGLLVLWAGVTLAVAAGKAPWTLTIRGAIGAALLASSVALNGWAVAALRSWRLLPEIDPDHELCTTGPYALVRHPVYLALDLLGIGTAVWLATIPVAIAALMLVAGGAARARREEQELVRAFGDAYRQYMRRVRRWFPRLGGGPQNRKSSNILGAGGGS